MRPWAYGIAASMAVTMLWVGPARGDTRAPQPLAVRYPDAESLTPVELGKRLVRDLHCVACHEVPPEVTATRRSDDGWPIAPALTSEGDKVQRAWLSRFLEEPFVLRPAALARMPTFVVTPEERENLTAYLAGLRAPEPFDLAAFDFDVHGPATEGARKFGALQLKLLRCNQCHLVNGKLWSPEDSPRSPDLAYAAERLQREWFYRWMVDPQRLEPGTKMPTFFYADDEEITDDPEAEIDALAKYIFSLGAAPAEVDQPARDTAGAGAAGRRLFDTHNCGGCHMIGDEPAPAPAGPPLTFEGARVQAGWLRQYFRTPHAIRPRGYRADKLDRMPDFRLSEPEVQAVAAYLMTLAGPAAASGIDWENRTPAGGEADRIWQARGCGDCHDRAATGDRVGPPRETMARLQTEFAYQYCLDAGPYGPPPGLEHPTVTPEEAAVLAPVLTHPLPSARG